MSEESSEHDEEVMEAVRERQELKDVTIERIKK
jgi:hypothetical protein